MSALRCEQDYLLRKLAGNLAADRRHPRSITAQVNTSGLTTAQQCAGEIDIAAPGASNPNVAIPVRLLVSTNPLLLVPSTGPTFTYQVGTSTQLAPQNVQITSSSAALNFTATAAPTTVGGPDFLTVTPGVGITPQTTRAAGKTDCAGHARSRHL